MADDSFDVLIRFITEMVGGGDASKAAVKNFGDLEKQIDDSNKSLDAQNKQLAEWRDQLKQMQIEMGGVRKGGLVYKQMKNDALLLKAAIIDGTTAIRENKKAHQDLVKQLENEMKVEESLQKIKKKAETIIRRTGENIGRFGTAAVVTGAAVGGGIIAEATRYAEKMGDATVETAKFNAELKKIQDARGRIDAVLVAQVTPILEAASKVASKVAGIIEKNPQLVSLALKGAALLVSIGTLAKIAASGIRMYADVAFIEAQAVGLTAAEMQLLASKNQLAAAGVKGVGGAGAGGAALGGGAITLIGAGILASFVAVVKFSEVISDMGENFGKHLVPVFEKMGPLGKGVADGLQKVLDKEGDIKEFLNSISGGLLFSSHAAGGAPGKPSVILPFGENTDQLVSAFMEMTDKIKTEDTKYSSDRLKITTDSNDAIEKANKDSAKRIEKINNDIIKINEKSAKDRDRITSDFITSTREDTRKYESERANIIRDGGLEIQRIEQDRLEKLRQLEMDHNDRVDELKANRDALGLVLEQRKFDRDKAELDRGTNIEIERRRQDLAIRLKDLAQSFQAERAQKLAQYQQDLADNEAKRLADLEEKKAQIAEENARKVEEINQIRKEAADKLRLLDENHKAEILRIREAFTARRQELGIFLQGEAAMIRQAHQAALAELQNYINSIGARTLEGAHAGGSLTPGHRLAGGYVHGNQMIQTHGTEFVASQTTTRALERLVGGRLNQNNLVGAVAGGQNIILNDSRRFDGTYTKAMRREVRNSTVQVIQEIFRK